MISYLNKKWLKVTQEKQKFNLLVKMKRNFWILISKEFGQRQVIIQKSYFDEYLTY